MGPVYNSESISESVPPRSPTTTVNLYNEARIKKVVVCAEYTIAAILYI